MTSWLRRSLEFVLPPLVLFALVMTAWDRAVVYWNIKPFLLPRPLDVWREAVRHSPELLAAMKNTAAGALCGFALSLVVGVLVAIVFAQSRVIQRSMYPYAIFLQTVPIVAIAPIVIIWFGPGFKSVVVVSFIISLFPIITNTTAGLTSIDPQLLELFEIHNASWLQRLLKLRLPSAVPNLVTGAKISCGLSVIGAIVGEVFAGYGTNAYGLGYLIQLTSGKLETAYAFAAMIASTLLGLAIFSLAALAGRTILARWQAGGQGKSRG